MKGSLPSQTSCYYSRLPLRRRRNSFNHLIAATSLTSSAESYPAIPSIDRQDNYP